MSRDYQTHYKNFIGKDWQQEKLYTPDKKLVETLHKVLDVIVDDNIALTIDHIVAQLMRCEGYGQPERYRELSAPELMTAKSTPPQKEIMK